RGEPLGLPRLVVPYAAVRQVQHVKTTRAQGIRVAPAAARGRPRLIPAFAQGAEGERHLGARRSHAVAVELALHRDVEIALALRIVRGVGEALDELTGDLLGTRGLEAARLAEHAAAVGHDVRGAATVDRADVRRGLGIDAP